MVVVLEKYRKHTPVSARGLLRAHVDPGIGRKR